jgi:hypothetical protein
MRAGPLRVAGTRVAPERAKTVMIDEFQKVAARLSVVLVFFKRR